MLPTLAHPNRSRQDPTHAPDRAAVAALAQVHARGLSRQRAIQPEDANLIRLAARADTAVLPRWHQEDRGLRDRSRGHHEEAPPGAYKGIRAWNGRRHWLDVVVPTALTANPDLVARSRVSPATFTMWAEIESGYVGRLRSGRHLIVRPSTVAQVMGMAERTIQRCRALARALGLLVDVVPGRMLTEEESRAARERGSRQRGLSTESALTIPPAIAHLVDRVTPTSGYSSKKKKVTLEDQTDSAASGTAGKEAASRPPKPKRRPAQPAVVRLARSVQDLIPWLRHEKIATLIPSLHRFATAERPWTAQDVVDGIDTITIRRGWTTVRAERIRTRPAAVLAWHLRQLDPIEDHPGPAFEQPRRANWPTWCGHCDEHTRHRWVKADGLSYRCHICHPLAVRERG